MKKTAKRPPRQARAQETYNLILESAESILKQDGIPALTTNRISEVGGVSIGSVYQYFKNKEEIIVECRKRYSEKYLSRFISSYEGAAPKDLRSAIEALARAVIHAHRVDAKAHAAMAEAGRYLKELRGQTAKQQSVYFNFFKDKLLDFEDEINQEDPKFFAHVFFVSVDRLVHVITNHECLAKDEEVYFSHIVQQAYAYLTSPAVKSRRKKKVSP